jgi:formylglycine-generating enzyme required for sulfatase activity
MQPPPPTTQAIAQLIDWCTAQTAPQAAQQPIDPLPRLWFDVQRGSPEPLWLDMARHLFRFPSDQVHTVLEHARALRRLPPDERPAPFQPPSQDGLQPAWSPEDILGYAASANGWQNHSHRLEPHNVSTHLLWCALRAGSAPEHAPRVLETLDLTQMLVYLPTRAYQAVLVALEMQAVDSGETHHQAAPALLPDARAALLRTDSSFRAGLGLVQTVLRRICRPDAPAITWRFSSLALPGDTVQSFCDITGDSASATLAYGALYLLRHHLNTDHSPAVAAVAEQLLNIETPASVGITAALCANGDAPWPTLARIDGAGEKLLALDSNLPPGRVVQHRFLAQEQIDQQPQLPAHGAQDLGTLVHDIARLTCSLSADARLLHQALQSGRSDESIANDTELQTAMQSLRSNTMPGTGVRAHLVWRYAKLCASQPSPFGDVARLGQHFVSMNVEGPQGHGDDTTQVSRVRDRLQDILYPPPSEPELHRSWSSVPAWCLLAPPFSGKSTLIQHWELSRIREALRAQARGQGWGEVPVFLPMNDFMRHSHLSQPSAGDLGRALRDYAKKLAPALPWDELLPEQPPTAAQLNTPRPDGLRIRLCIDALNEYRTGQANEGSAIRLLCDWLAPRCAPDRPGALLPPLFSVRREEAANFELSAHNPHDAWVAHNIQVKWWRPSQMRAYILQRSLPLAVEERLLEALQFPGRDASDDDLHQADAQGPSNPLAKFSQVPGFLSAQCTLLERWPDLPISGRRAHIMLALAWHGLDKWQRSSDFNDLQDRANTDPTLAALLAWLIPESAREQLQYMSKGQGLVLEWEPGLAGGLLDGLARVADAMQDPEGKQPEESALWPTRNGGTGLREVLTAEWPRVLGGNMPEQWLAQAVASGLLLKTLQQERPNSRALPWLSFSHQQLQEFFSALSVAPERLPDLTPPPFTVRTQDLEQHLREGKIDRLERPAVTPHTERLRYAADLASPEGAERLIAAVLAQGNLALAAQLAIDQRERLEPPIDTSGRVVSHGCWFPERCRPLLQHLRARLLLASVDTGVAHGPQLHASGILAGIADTVQRLPEPWRSQWAPLLPALRDPANAAPQQDPSPGWPEPLTTGVDLRWRLDFGLLLGELGDNIRYERWAVKAEGRVGIRLKAAHWAAIPASGPQATHRIGDKHWDDSQPLWVVPEGKLPAMRFAQSPAVVMQWQAYVQDLQARGEPAPKLRAMDQSRWSNPLQAITSLDWFTAQAFTAWMAPLHKGLFPELDGAGEDEKAQLALPTEVQHEAAVRFNPAAPHPQSQAKWPHDPNDQREPDQMPPDLFNHNLTRWGAPAPVGVFSAALTPTGIEAMGNVWTWCANVKTDHYQGKNARQANRPYTATPEEWREDAKAAAAAGEAPPLLALRGGSFGDSADDALAAYRFRGRPDGDGYDIGLRWVMCRPIP